MKSKSNCNKTDLLYSQARIWMWVWYIMVLGTLGPLDPWTLGLLDLFPLPTPPHTSPYILLPPPISSSYSPPLVWFGYGGRMGWVVTFDNEIGDGPLTFILNPWDLLLPSTFSSSNLLPPPSYSSQLLHPPPKPPPNSSYLLLKALRWLIRSYMKRFQCYSAQKSFLGGGGWWHCNYSYKLQVQVS